ncbi:MAG: hypothetical protein K6T26_08660, partial [Alicyclobacillus sp.]|nr:hypothetical protein [Alicyclobacillus sp.]
MTDVAVFLSLGTLLISVWPQALFFPYSALWVAGLVLGCTGWMLGLLPRAAWLTLLPWSVGALGYLLALSHAADAGAAQSGAIEH